MAPESSFKLTYATMFNPPEELHQRFDEALARLKANFGKEYGMHPAEKADEIAMDLWNRTEILYTDIVVPEAEAVPNLRWIQYHYAGVDFLLDTPLPEKKDLQITTMTRNAKTTPPTKNRVASGIERTTKRFSLGFSPGRTNINSS